MKLNDSSFLKEIEVEWKSLSDSKRSLYFLYLLVLVKLALPFIRAIENRIGLSFFMDYSDAFFLIVFALGSIRFFLNTIKIIDIVFLVSLIVLHFVSSNFNTSTSQFAVENESKFMWTCLPMFLVGLTIDSKFSSKLFVAIAYVAFFLQILYLYVLGMGVDEEGNEVKEAMGVAYSFLPFACILFWNAFERGGVVHWIVAVLAAFILLSLGTRGPIVCLVFFVAFYLVMFKQFKNNVLSKGLIILSAIIVYFYSLEIAMFFSVISEQLGLSSRVFDSIIEGQMTNIQESNGRDYIWGGTIEQLRENGIWLDFSFYADRLYNPQGHQYVHNLELELLCDFGLIGGSVLILLLALLIIRAFKSVWKTEAVGLLLVFFSSSIMQLQFSESFLSTSVFWLFLGMCIAMVRDRNKFFIKSQLYFKQRRFKIKWQ